jgi:hypothetical protein
MRIDTGFVSPLIVGLLFVCAGVAGIFTGKHITKGRITSIGPEFIGRKESPIIFWLHVATSIGCGTFLLVLAFIHAVRV